MILSTKYTPNSLDSMSLILIVKCPRVLPIPDGPRNSGGKESKVQEVSPSPRPEAGPWLVGSTVLRWPENTVLGI